MTLSVISLWQHFEVQMVVFVLDFWTFKWACFSVRGKKINLKQRRCNIPNDAWSDVFLSLTHPLFLQMTGQTSLFSYSTLCISVSSYSYTSLLLQPPLSPRHCNADVSHKVAGNFHWRCLWKRNMRERERREGHERDGAKGGRGQKRWEYTTLPEVIKKKSFCMWKPWALECGKSESIW